MRYLLPALAGALIGSTLFVADAEAKRLGSARSLGVQRNVGAVAPTAPTRQAQPAPAAQQPASPAAPATSRWLPALGGLAMGGLLGSLFSSSFGGVFQLAVLTFVVIAYLWMRARPRAAPLPPLRYAGLGNETVVAPPPSQALGSAAPHSGQAGPKVPADFDVAGFLRAAKLNFIKLQVASDMGNLDEIRQFTTTQMYDELHKDFAKRGGARHHTDVVALAAELLEVATEGDSHVASVRFSGTIRESPGAAPAGFAEVWNLAKPVDGSSGWLLAGIQQMH